MPILGVVASGISGHLSTLSYDSIATYVASTNTKNFTFSSIPQTYKHLQIRAIMRSNRTGIAATGTDMYFNGDNAGTSYTYHLLRGDGSAVISIGGADESVGSMWYSSTTANVFSAVVIDILDYANTNKYKTAKILNGLDNNGTGYISYASFAWKSTSAITSITCEMGGAFNFTQYSSIALYGIK